jgi:microcystin-dependent protein
VSDCYLGEIRLFPFDYAPYGWAICQGQIMSIAQNSALFSILGVTYGGNGTSTFALPKLQGSVALGTGQGAGLSNYALGQTGGATSVSLLSSQMPAHTHSLTVNTGDGNSLVSTGNQLSKPASGARGSQKLGALYTPNSPNAQMSPSLLQASGGGLAHNNMQPYLAMNYCIALQGMYPPRP